MRVAKEQMARAGVTVPLIVSHKGLLEQVGPLGKAWRTEAGSEPEIAFR